MGMTHPQPEPYRVLILHHGNTTESVRVKAQSEKAARERAVKLHGALKALDARLVSETWDNYWQANRHRPEVNPYGHNQRLRRMGR